LIVFPVNVTRLQMMPLTRKVKTPPVVVMRVLAICLLIQISDHMGRFHAHVGSADSTLQKISQKNQTNTSAYPKYYHKYAIWYKYKYIQIA
jgi:hypothetical protein